MSILWNEFCSKGTHCNIFFVPVEQMKYFFSSEKPLQNSSARCPPLEDIIVLVLVKWTNEFCSVKENQDNLEIWRLLNVLASFTFCCEAQILELLILFWNSESQIRSHKRALASFAAIDLAANMWCARVQAPPSSAPRSAPLPVSVLLTSPPSFVFSTRNNVFFLFHLFLLFQFLCFEFCIQFFLGFCFKNLSVHDHKFCG